MERVYGKVKRDEKLFGVWPSEKGVWGKKLYRLRKKDSSFVVSSVVVLSSIYLLFYLSTLTTPHNTRRRFEP